MPAPLTAHPLHTDCISLGGDFSSRPPARGKAVAAVNGGRNIRTVFVRNGKAMSNIRSCCRQQPDRGEAAAAPQVRPAARQSGLSQWAHAHTYIQHTYTQHTYTYKHGQTHRSARTETLRTRTNAKSTNGLVLFPSLADQDESTSGENLYM